MNRDALVERVAKQVGIPKRTADAALGAITENIEDAVASGEKVTLVGFGTFEPRKRAGRTGRNPRTGQPLTISERTVPVFNPGKVFRERVSGR